MSTDISTDISTDVSVDISADTSVEGCTKYTWSQNAGIVRPIFTIEWKTGLYEYENDQP